MEEKINRSIGNEWFRTKISYVSLDKFSYANSSYPIACSLVKKYKEIDKPYWGKNDIERATQKNVERIMNFSYCERNEL